MWRTILLKLNQTKSLSRAIILKQKIPIQLYDKQPVSIPARNASRNQTPYKAEADCNIEAPVCCGLNGSGGCF
jgi:hypothetical protein